MKLLLEKITPDELAKLLQNKALRVFGITPISEGYRPDQPEQMQTLYNVEVLVVGELRKRFLDQLVGRPSA